MIRYFIFYMLYFFLNFYVKSIFKNYNFSQFSQLISFHETFQNLMYKKYYSAFYNYF